MHADNATRRKRTSFSHRSRRLAVIATVLLASAVRSHAQTVTRMSGMSHPSENLVGVWASGPDDVYAAGGYRGLARFNGEHWNSEDVGTWANRYKVMGTGPGVVYSSGQFHYQTGSLIRRVDNGPWNLAFQASTELVGLWVSPTGEVLVGGDGRFFHSPDGEAFHEAPTGLSHEFNVDRIENIWGVSARDAYIASRAGLFHWDGETFARVNMPRQEMTSVHHSGTSWWATNATGQVWFGGGDTWTLLNTGVPWQLSSIWAFDDDDVWVGGGHGELLHYNGSTWREFETGTTAKLSSMWAIDSRTLYVAVGEGPGALLRVDVPRTSVPEPGSLTLLLVSTAALLAWQQHKARRRDAH